jgi:hypothetical protein
VPPASKIKKTEMLFNLEWTEVNDWAEQISREFLIFGAAE